MSLLPAAVLAGCGDDGTSASSSSSETLTLYTCVNDTTIQPVIEEFERSSPGTQIDLFRAPTGEINARVASDSRSGGLRADVIWGCDPLTMADYVEQDLVGGWTPDNASDIPEEFRTADYVGVAILYMLAVHGRDVPAPASWSDLTGPEYADGVAVPDPSFAASALGALGYFAQNPDYGLDFYAGLEENGAVQVATPDDVTTGVAEGVHKAGITIANSAYVAQDAGSPVEIVWPEPGGIAIYGPVALARDSADSQVAKDFITYVASREGQALIGESGSYPTLPGVEGPAIPEGSPIVSPDWASLSQEQDSMLAAYQKIFGG